MTTDLPNWKLIDDATRDLEARGVSPFSRVQVYKELWRKHPDRQRPSLDPTFQGMVESAAGGPPSRRRNATAAG